MCCSLFQLGEIVKLANGNPTLGTVIHENEPSPCLHVLDNAVLVTWEEAVPAEFEQLVICKYYDPEELIHVESKKG